MTNKQKIIKIFKDRGVEYWTEGKNVSDGSVNITCPFCNDHSNHCGIFEDTLVFHCWICGASGPIEALLETLLGIGSREADDLLGNVESDFKTSSLEQIDRLICREVSKAIEANRGKEIEWPEYSVPITRDTESLVLDRYLKRRKISLATVILHNCRLCEAGRYMHRMIIPVYFSGKLVSYQAADLTGKAYLKYETAPGKINDYLYGYDQVTEEMILVEGILDAWRLGPGACATFGTHITNNQKNLIEDKKLKKLIFCWDSDAYWKAKNQAGWFKPFIREVKVIKLPEGEDPDSYGKIKTFSLINFSD